MNWNMVGSFFGKACLLLAGVGVGAGVVDADTQQAVAKLVAGVPQLVKDAAQLVTYAGAVYSGIRTLKTHWFGKKEVVVLKKAE